MPPRAPSQFSWDVETRKLLFDFDEIAVLGIRVTLPKGGAAKIGASTGLGSENNIKLEAAGKKPVIASESRRESLSCTYTRQC